ncbi:putative membrane channel-forming protein YqfA (hemolysin III family) [Faecalicoccus acidiformans]|uniref:Putative membrane channel-forming protein YqfA (Hemolysin III family) n=2 Tax=Faecalicoccus acidiformans TaxID=915173 RepID=A0A7W8D123_9FIRM|nr:putative membrane channel-forming protein YqfA (hemolysin III family) [Faecalicoccus acidiformans]
MTTSLYHLIQGNLSASLMYHAMLIPTGVFALLIGICQWKKKKKWMERFLWMWIGCMIVYYIYRMIFIFPDIPMVYDSSSLLGYFLNR